MESPSLEVFSKRVNVALGVVVLSGHEHRLLVELDDLSGLSNLHDSVML